LGGRNADDGGEVVFDVRSGKQQERDDDDLLRATVGQTLDGSFDIGLSKFQESRLNKMIRSQKRELIGDVEELADACWLACAVAEE
jgi:hypothetical protein